MPSPFDLRGRLRRRPGRALVLCILAAAVVVVIALWSHAGQQGFTGVSVTVPACPSDVEGCRVLITRVADGGIVGHDDWSGAARTFDVALAAGRYAVSAEGCKGDSIQGSVVSVDSGTHTAVDLGTSWDLPSFPGRVCPGFLPAPVTARSG
jgi:hypothetical protein